MVTGHRNVRRKAEQNQNRDGEKSSAADEGAERPRNRAGDEQDEMCGEGERMRRRRNQVWWRDCARCWLVLASRLARSLDSSTPNLGLSASVF